MTEISESEYMDLLEHRLVEYHGVDNVRREPRLQNGREPDFVVRVWPFTLAIEVENSSEDAIEGTGQAALYMGGKQAWAGGVVFPPDWENEDEIEKLSEHLPIAAVRPRTLRKEQ